MMICFIRMPDPQNLSHKGRLGRCQVKYVAMISELKGPLFRSSGFKLTLLLTLTVLSLVLMFTGEAYSATYYVAPNGNDASAGTSTAPWATFAKSMTVLKPGDTLYLKDGMYTQPLN